MKNKLVIIFISLIFVTGCGKSQLNCEKKEKNAGYDYTESYKFIYDEKKENIKQIQLVMESRYNEFYSKEEIEEEYNDVLEYCDFYESGSNKLIECKPKLDKKVITVQVTIKVDKISDDLFESMMYVTKEEINNLKDTKKMLENVGYRCKI